MITKQIFMGNGEHSIAQLYELHDALYKAAAILGSIQQAREDSELSQHTEQMFDLAHIVDQISVALLGIRVFPYLKDKI